MRLQRILAPVDFSAHADQAAIIAAELARRFGAELMLLHVDPIPGVSTVLVEPVYIPPTLFQGLHEDYNRRIDSNMEQLVERLRTHHAGAVKVTAERALGGVHEGILAQADEWHADLIVMGSSGLHGAARLILGSVADQVSRTAPCPVLITRARHDDERPHIPFRHILAGIDYSLVSTPLVQLAARMAAPSTALELMHVWSPPYISVLDAHLGGDDSTPLSRGIGLASAAEADRLQSFTANLDLPGATCFVGAGSSISNALLDRADEIGADLLVVGAHDRRDLSERMLGTTADRILRHASISVLLLPAPDGDSQADDDGS